VRRRPQHLVRHGLHALALLERRIHHCALVPDPGLGIAAAQLDGACQCLLAAHGVAAPEQDLSQIAVRLRVLGG
jgi:hypothetical protein